MLLVLSTPAALRFRQDVKRHADGLGPGQDLVMVFMEAIELDPSLTLVSSDIHLEMEGYPAEQGGVRNSAAAARQPGSGAGIWVRREALRHSPWTHLLPRC